MPIFSEPHKISEHEAWFRRQVQAGLDSANTGDVVPAEQIEAEAIAWRADLEMRLQPRITDAGKIT